MLAKRRPSKSSTNRKPKHLGTWRNLEIERESFRLFDHLLLLVCLVIYEMSEGELLPKQGCGAKSENGPGQLRGNPGIGKASGLLLRNSLKAGSKRHACGFRLVGLSRGQKWWCEDDLAIP